MFCIYGEDEYLLKLNKKNIINKLNIDKNKLVIKEYDLEENYDAIKMDLLTNDLFASQNTTVRVFKGINFFNEKKGETKKFEHFEDFYKIIISLKKEPIIFISSNGTISKRLKTYQKFEKIMKFIEVPKLNDINKKKMILNFGSENKINFDSKLIEYLQESLPNNANILMNELYKIKSLKITEANLENTKIFTSIYNTKNNFELVDLLLDKKYNEFFKTYYVLKLNNMNLNLIVSLILSSITIIRDIKILLNQKVSFSKISQILAVHPYRVQVLSKKINSYTIDNLNKIIVQLHYVDKMLKSNYGQSDLVLELTLIKILLGENHE